jgi:AcrR family transcriptional regulator
MIDRVPDATDISGDDLAAPRGRIRDAERTKAKLLAAATKEFAQRGYGSARIDRIVARAGVGKQALYYHFRSKEALYVAVLEEAYSGLRAAEAELDIAHRGPAEAIRELALSIWEYHRRHPGLISLVNTENLHRAKYLKRSAKLAALNSPIIDQLSNALARGAEDGSFREDVDAIECYMTIAALSFYYLSNRWTLETNFRRDLLAPERTASWSRHIVEVILASLAPPATGGGAKRLGPSNGDTGGKA